MSIFYVNPVTVEDYRRLACRRLPRFLFDYIDGGANREETLIRNEQDFKLWHLKQRVMKDVNAIDTSTMLMDQAANMPLALAPVGMAGMMARRGETLGARAAQHAGIPFTTSTVGICSVEEVQASINAPFWFQLYMLRDRDLVLTLLERAKNAQCDTLVFTVDLAVPGIRLRDFKNGMLGGGIKGKLSQLAQFATSPHWAVNVGLRGKPHNFGNLSDQVANPNDLDEYKAFIGSQFDPGVTWEDIAWLREQWDGKLLIKGVLEVEDAQAARDAGADGVVVSNHGARQLDGIASSVAKLPAIADAVGSEIEILIDGGIRNGIDILKSVALGANGALIGRPWVFALAGAGQSGLESLLDLYQQEIAVGMALMGVTKLSDVNKEVIESSGL
jgi:L-lactate dehydrogenase (cytochrome)